MSLRVIDRFFRDTWWCPRLGVLALAASMLLVGCATAVPSTRGATGDGEERVFVTLPTDFAPVRVGDAEFSAAVASLVLELPLRVASADAPMRPGRGCALASGALVGQAWQSELARSYGRYCERCGTPGDCLSLFEDGSHLRDDDKRRISLAEAVRSHPMKKTQWKTLSTERLVEEFATLSAEHGRDIEGARPKAANRKFDVLVEIQRELRSRGVEAQQQLLWLIDSAEPGTRYWVSSFALEFAPVEAEKVLAELAKIPRSLVGFTAQWTLKQWKEGNFKNG